MALRWSSGFCCPKCGSRNAMRVQAAHRRNAVNRVPLS
ncbi:transposase [Alicyclobacillus sp. ALC3]